MRTACVNAQHFAPLRALAQCRVGTWLPTCWTLTRRLCVYVCGLLRVWCVVLSSCRSLWTPAARHMDESVVAGTPTPSRPTAGGWRSTVLQPFVFFVFWRHPECPFFPARWRPGVSVVRCAHADVWCVRRWFLVFFVSVCLSVCFGCLFWLSRLVMWLRRDARLRFPDAAAAAAAVVVTSTVDRHQVQGHEWATCRR